MVIIVFIQLSTTGGYVFSGGVLFPHNHNGHKGLHEGHDGGYRKVQFQKKLTALRMGKPKKKEEYCKTNATHSLDRDNSRSRSRYHYRYRPDGHRNKITGCFAVIR